MLQPKLIRITTVPMSLDKLIEGQMAFMSKNGFEVLGVSSPENLLKTVAEKEGVRVKGIEMSRKITPLKDLLSLIKLVRLFKKENPQIVHSHTPKAGIVGMLAAKLAGVPIRLHTVAGLPLLEAVGLKRKLLNVVEKLTYSCATNVYPNSFGLKDIILKEQFCNEKKLKVLANGSTNGINTKHFNPKTISNTEKQNLKQSLNIDNDTFVFVFVGRLVGDKGINELVKAFKKLQNSKNKNHKSKLLLVGPLEHNLDPLKEETIQEINNNVNIISVGYQQDIRPYLAISNVLTFPSYREGFPNVVMQAGAMGLPSIVSNINGCNEIIKNNVNGIIIPPKNVDKLYWAMHKLLKEKSFTLSLQKEARELIVSNYEQSNVWKAILNEYNDLLKNV